MLKKVKIMALAAALSAGVAAGAQAAGTVNPGLLGGATGIPTSPTLTFHPRPPGVSTGTYCNLNPGYLEHPCF